MGWPDWKQKQSKHVEKLIFFLSFISYIEGIISYIISYIADLQSKIILFIYFLINTFFVFYI